MAASSLCGLSNFDKRDELDLNSPRGRVMILLSHIDNVVFSTDPISVKDIQLIHRQWKECKAALEELIKSNDQVGKGVSAAREELVEKLRRAVDLQQEILGQLISLHNGMKELSDEELADRLAAIDQRRDEATAWVVDTGLAKTIELLRRKVSPGVKKRRSKL